MKWNDDWRRELERDNEGCYIRLCECRNTKKDILTMAKLMYEYNSNIEKEECLDRTCEWVCCWNSQFECELTDTEYKTFLSKM